MRVVIAEDSPTIRELLVALLEGDPEIQVVGQARTGAEAVELTLRLRPDLIAMDIHMPTMDGLEATREVMARAPTPIVLITSTTSREDAHLSLEALRAGALMIIPKPENPASPTFNGRRDHLLSMVKAMAEVKVVRRWSHGPASRPVVRRRGDRRAPQLVAVAASTGGPASLQRILRDLPAAYPAPIVIVQHIATGFAAPLAEWLNAACPMRVKLAEHGEAIDQRTIYLAPDERHLSVADDRLHLLDEPPVGGHRPSATVLFESAARAYGSALAAVMLTGMGRDGVDGLRAVRAGGGWIVAQDEATSVVHGMPGEAIRAGLADTVLPLDAIGPHLAALGSGS